MTEEERVFLLKKNRLQRECYYGFRHFCDGTPNLSATNNNISRPPCPNRSCCELRQNRIFKTLEEEREGI